MSQEDEDIARLFRENDNVGPDSSLWLRPLRQLFNDGKPIGQVVAIRVSPARQEKVPFGMLTQTEKNRLVFWPILPPGAKMICAGEQVNVFDHITLEFPSERIHMTAYDGQGQPIHVARAWRTYHCPDCDFALWFTLLVRVSILRQQDMAIQRCVQMPTRDQERRVNEFRRYTQNLSFVDVSLPQSDGEYDYIYCILYLAFDSIKAQPRPPSVFPADSSIGSQIEDWPEGNMFQIARSLFSIDQRTICVATACPPGKLRSDVVVGFPQRISSQSTDTG